MPNCNFNGDISHEPVGLGFPNIFRPKLGVKSSFLRELILGCPSYSFGHIFAALSPASPGNGISLGTSYFENRNWSTETDHITLNILNRNLFDAASTSFWYAAATTIRGIFEDQETNISLIMQSRLLRILEISENTCIIVHPFLLAHIRSELYFLKISGGFTIQVALISFFCVFET